MLTEDKVKDLLEKSHIERTNLQICASNDIHYFNILSERIATLEAVLELNQYRKTI